MNRGQYCLYKVYEGLIRYLYCIKLWENQIVMNDYFFLITNSNNYLANFYSCQLWPIFLTSFSLFWDRRIVLSATKPFNNKKSCSQSKSASHKILIERFQFRHILRFWLWSIDNRSSFPKLKSRAGSWGAHIRDMLFAHV